MIVAINFWSFLQKILVSTIVLGLFCLPAIARDISQDSVLELRKQGRVKSLGCLLGVVDKNYPNFTLLDTILKEQQGQYFYTVSIITKQAVTRELVIDAATTNIIQDKVDN